MIRSSERKLSIDFRDELLHHYVYNHTDNQLDTQNELIEYIL